MCPLHAYSWLAFSSPERCSLEVMCKQAAGSLSCAVIVCVVSGTAGCEGYHSLGSMLPDVQCNIARSMTKDGHFLKTPGGVETHVSLGAHIPISVRPSSFALLSTATRTQPARELSDAQLGTPDRVLRRSCMSSYSLSLPASIAITRNSFGSVWTSSHYSAQPPHPTCMRALQCTAWYT